jgi:hypothetical protein
MLGGVLQFCQMMPPIKWLTAGTQHTLHSVRETARHRI